MNSKILQALHSKTVWTMIVGLVFNILVPQLNISPELRDLVNGVIVLVAGYFHINPVTAGQYSPAGVTPPVTPVVVDTTTDKIVSSAVIPQSATVVVTPTPPLAQ